MFNHKNRYKILSKAIAIVLVCLFLVNDIAWALPKTSTLATQSIFNPIINAVGIQRQRQVELELSGIIAMALRGLKRDGANNNRNKYISFLNINSALDHRCDKKDFTERTLEILDSPAILENNPGKPIVIRIKPATNPGTQRYFKIIFRGDKLEDMFDASKIEVMEERADSALAATPATPTGPVAAVEKNDPRRVGMEIIEGIARKGLNLKGPITRDSLSGAIQLFKESDVENRNKIVGQITDAVIEMQREVVPSRGKEKKFGTTDLLNKAKVAGVDVCAPLDITLVWEKTSDGSLRLANFAVDAGGGATNTAKAVANNGQYFGLLKLMGNDAAAGTMVARLAKEHIIASFISTNSGQKINIIHVVENESVGGTSNLGGAIVSSVIDDLLAGVRKMLNKSPNMKWLTITAGGRILSKETPRAYSSILDIAHEHGVDALVDFNYNSSREEIKAVLEAKRKNPADIITPNMEEFILILKKTGVYIREGLSKGTITDDEIIEYSRGLIGRYNLRGVLIKRDKNGLILVLPEKVVKTAAVPVDVVSVTGAGDAANSGFMLAMVEGKSWEDAVSQANLFGAATVTMPGSSVATPEAIKHILTASPAISISNELLLLNRASVYLRNYPVDETIDLSLIPKEDLEANMKTWAYIIALNDKHGLNVNYIFESDDETYRTEAKRSLFGKIDEIKDIDHDAIKVRVTDRCRPDALQVHIMKKEDVEKLEIMSEGVLPVALSEGTALEGTPLRDFISASAIGLAQAACKIMQTEKDPHLSEVIEQEILPRMQNIYKRLFPDKDIKGIVTKETIFNMIDYNPIVRRNLAIALALPPIIRAAIQYLKDYHDRIHVLQQAA